MRKVLVVGYGSIGKRHVENLLSFGISPIIVEINQVMNENIEVLDKIPYNNDINDCIIATPTVSHYDDFLKVIEKTNCKNILIEKPIDMDLNNAKKILRLADKYNIRVRIAYNLRYLNVFEKVREVINKFKSKIRIVKITCGQYLPDWRPSLDYRKSYSSHVNQGGGVDLDLSHEIDYMIWLFGYPKNIISKIRKNISKLEINSIDYFKGLYDYGNFIIDLELDYIRKKERNLRLIGENTDILSVDFINQLYIYNHEKIIEENLFDFDLSYQLEIKEFLGLSNTSKLSTIEDSIKVLELI